jgi:transcriptional regulator with GAF, ATPase, and Fis domain/serine/threonine protein kinase/Tfp pilus assembly protein PilF
MMVGDIKTIPERYEVLEPIGKGPWSDVYKARDKTLGKIVALKVGGSALPKDAEVQVEREFYFLSRFDHPHIVKVFDFGFTEDGHPFFTMEFVDGIPITQYFKGFTSQIYSVIGQICQALETIHNQGLVHCDLKPENILIRKGELQAVILDFGFAEEIIQPEARISRGTIGYIAPEVFKGTGADGRADLYSLGLVLYETIGQRRPFGEESPISQLKTQYYSDLPSLRSLDPNIPEELDNLILQLVKKEPQARPASAYDVLESLIRISKATISLPVFEEPRKFILTSGFVGREGILEELKRLWQKAAGSEGSVVFITGEHGVGKSRFLKEFKFLVQLERASVISYDPIVSGEKTRPFLQHLALQIPDLKETDILSPEGNKKYELFEGLITGLKRLSPLVLLLDDIYLLDPLGLEFFRYLALSIPETKILLVATSLCEPEQLDLIKSFILKSHIHHNTLPSLTQEETTRLATSLLVVMEKPEQMSNWLYERTGGNPLFIYETIRSLIDQSILKRRPKGWILDGERLLSYKPAKRIKELISSRLSNLSLDEIRILRWASAIGRSFGVQLLPEKDSSKFAVIESLVAKGFLNSVINNGRMEYVFANKTIKELVDEEIKGEERRKIYRQVAERLETVYPENEVLFELTNAYSGAGVKDKTYYYSLKAAKQGHSAYLLQEALRYYQIAQSLATDRAAPEEHLIILESIGDIQKQTGLFSEAIDTYDHAVELLNKDKRFFNYQSLLPRFSGKIGYVYQLEGKTAEAIAKFKTTQKLLSEKPSPEAFKIANSLGWAYISSGDYEQAEEIFNRALSIAQNLKDEKAIAEVLYSLGSITWYKKDLNQAIEFCEKSRKISEQTNHNYLLSTVNHFLGTLHWQQGNLEKAKDYYEQALSFQQKTASFCYLVRTLHGLGLIQKELSQWVKSRGYLEEALNWAEKVNDLNEIANIRSDLGWVLVETGEWQKAMEHYQQSLEVRKKSGDEKLLAPIVVNIGVLLMKRGELNQANDFFQEALKVEERLKIYERFYLYCDLVKLYQLQGHYKASRKFLAVALKMARQTKNSRWLAKIFLLLSELNLSLNNFPKALFYTKKVLDPIPAQSKEYGIGLRFSGVAKFLSGDKEGLNVVRESIKLLRSLGAKYELAHSLYEAARLGVKSAPTPTQLIEDVTLISGYLEEADNIYQQLGAGLDLEKTQKLRNEIYRRLVKIKPQGLAKREYLRIFSDLSELINLGLEKEDFLERILDLVIDITNAERGLLFLLENNELRLVAGRNTDHTTVEDAKSISQSITRQVEEVQETVFCADALSDPRFDATRSVLLNKIHSILCAPLKVYSEVIGTIYLDSRITTNLFLEEEKDFLFAVANLLAATIDKSVAFKKLEDEVLYLREGIIIDAATGYFLGKSAAVREIYAEVEKIAPTDCTVLILGETGSGKGILARLIHNRSKRMDNKFVSVNCGTLSETLFESELFGHKKGAFTGASSHRRGIIETATNGTVFLDEITNTTTTIQGKLLELLDDKTIRRLGDDESRRVDVRLVCATNRDLKKEIAAERFREDLYYRLNVVTIKVPPLRDRQEDIPLLARYFMERSARQMNKKITGFNRDVLSLFLKYPWPGNVRELQNTIERAVIMAGTGKIGLSDLKFPFTMEELKSIVALRDEKKTFERERIIAALKKTEGNITQTAKFLSINRQHLHTLLKMYKIERKEYS